MAVLIATSVARMAEEGALWCPAVYCAGSEKQLLHPTEHDPSLYRCSCCGTDWSLVALAAQYAAQERA